MPAQLLQCGNTARVIEMDVRVHDKFDVFNLKTKRANMGNDLRNRLREVSVDQDVTCLGRDQNGAQTIVVMRRCMRRIHVRGYPRCMVSRLRVAQLLICCFSCTLPAVAQLDSTALRMKYGTPLNRETFHMPAGFDLIVDYGASNQVCRLRVPALMPTTAPVSNAAAMKQRMYEFLGELVPDSMRGKELGRMASMMGAVSIVSIEYEQVTVSELQVGQPFSNDNTITVTFKSGTCQSTDGN